MRIIGFGLIVLGVGLILLTRIAETVIIIQMGIQIFSLLSILPFSLIGVGIVVLCFGFAPIIKKRLATKAEVRQREETKKIESMQTLSYSADRYDPKDIERRLNKIKEQRPDLVDAIDKCESQMDSMNRRQAKLKELLDLNKADYLRPTEQLLDEVEQFICKNFRKVINRGIVSDTGDDDVFARDDKYLTYLELIEAVIASNQIELDHLSEFLVDLASLVSENYDDSVPRLHAWMETIRDSLKKEAI